MAYITTIQVTEMITTMTAFIVDNYPAILLFLTFMFGIRMARSFINSAKNGDFGSGVTGGSTSHKKLVMENEKVLSEFRKAHKENVSLLNRL